VGLVWWFVERGHHHLHHQRQGALDAQAQVGACVCVCVCVCVHMCDNMCDVCDNMCDVCDNMCERQHVAIISPGLRPQVRSTPLLLSAIIDKVV
jgi:hypothetical protein